MKIFLICIAALCLLIGFLFCKRYNSRGFNRKGMHRNGTRYDDFGYDFRGYDRNGFDCLGYDRNGFDADGYCREGYNREGRNRKGQYNRCFDCNSEKDGFYSLQEYPIGVTKHARERMAERMSIYNPYDADKLALEAYCYGKSKRQIKKSSHALIEEIESRRGGDKVLIYHGYIYIFSKENSLITVYKNNRIPL